MRLFSLLLTSTFASASALADQAPSWSFYPGFYAPGEAGIQVVDLDADGAAEVVVSGTTGHSDPNLLALLERNGDAMRVTHLVRLAPGEAFVGSIHILPAVPPLAERILAQVADEDSTRLVTFAGRELVPVAAVPVDPGFELHGLGDVDADGSLDVFGTILAPYQGWVGRPQVRDLASGAVKWTESTRKAKLLAAGQVDSDAALELVFSGDPFAYQGDPNGYVIDGATHATEWTYPGGFFGQVTFGNFDTNGATREFAVSYDSSRTFVFGSAPVYARIGEFPVEAQRTLAHDFDSDGIDEILAGRFLDVVAFHPVDWSVMFDHPNPALGVTALGLGNLDADASLEVVYGAGNETTGEDRLTVFDVTSLAIQYERDDEAGPHSGLLVADLDGNGSREVVIATRESDSGYEGPNLVVLDAASGVPLRRRDDILDPNSELSVVQLRAANLDADPQLEIIAGGQSSFDGRVRVFDSSSLGQQWVFTVDDQTYYHEVLAVQALELVHANGDAFPDIAAAVDGRLYLLDGASGVELWRSQAFDDVPGLTLAVGNMDSDPAMELSLGVGRTFHQFDASTRLLERSFTHPEPILGQAVEGAGDTCRLVLYESTRLVRRHCSDLTQESVRRYVADATFVRPVGDSRGRLVLSDGYRLILQRGNKVAQGTLLGPRLGWDDAGVVFDTGTGAEVFVGDEVSVNRIELIDAGDELFYDGYE